MAAKLGVYDARVIVHTNSDGSVDGELRLEAPAKPIDTFRAISETFEPLRGVWASAGGYYSNQKVIDRSDLSMHRGLGGFQTYARTSNLGAERLLKAGEISETIADKYGARMQAAVLRLRWHPKNEQPKYQHTGKPRKKLPKGFRLLRPAK